MKTDPLKVEAEIMQGIYLVRNRCPSKYGAVVRFNTPTLSAPYHKLLCEHFTVLNPDRRSRAIRMKKTGYQYYYLNKKDAHSNFWADMTEVFGVRFK